MKLWYSSQFPSKTSWPTFRVDRFFNRLPSILIICACPAATVLSTSSFFIPIFSFLPLLRNIPYSFPMPWLMNITLSFPMSGFSNYWWSYSTVLLNLQYFPSTVDASNALDLVFAYTISCWTFSSPVSFSAICHLIKDDSLTSSSACFASSFTALVLELSNSLLQLHLFEAFGLLLLLVTDELAFVGL